MKTLKLLVILAALVGLSACATKTTTGYSDQAGGPAYKKTIPDQP